MWKGGINFTLESFITQHQNASVSMQTSAKHVTCQLTNEHSRVGYMLDAIQCSYYGFQDVVSIVKIDQAINGLRNGFEADSNHLLPYNPLQKNRVDHTGGKCRPDDISDTMGE